jgi:fido (protein-threonine AMPylation protein)
MFTLAVVLVLLAVAFLGYKLYQKNADAKAAVNQVTAGVTAFAKLADAEGKIIALKAATAVKTAEASAVHAGLDEIHKLLG